ncbi:hypothetical protein K431DRAFT_282675 [Polychaeton citri CBS 116435]|uniref:Amine oxidase domain-containing protein n=1 Tax=Polychaeton citri CBS 116435 TaxID=1314669 RepID=A0A9P4UR61_9PEZI|nr:hypothetical protein K431DRAFT_282675 [Polychaeton citri CBS 116435]
MHETSQNKLVKLIRRLGIEYYYDDGLALYYTEHGRAGAQFKAKKVADEFADYVESYYKEKPNAPDRPVSEFIADFVNDHELITEDERTWAPQAVKEMELWVGTSVEQASSKHLSYFITERNLYMTGGYDRIVNWTAEPLKQQPNAIRLNHFVETIDWSDDNSSAITYRNETGTHTMHADAVVVTIPLGALHHNLVKFQPQLPIELREGLSRYSYGALGKVFFEFADVFWSKDNDQFMYYPTPDLLDEDPVRTPSSTHSASSSGQDNILNYATVTINLWIMTGSKQLCVQIAEPLTQRIEAMTDKRELYKFFEPLFKLLRTEPYRALPRLINLETTHWTQDPLAGYGSYSADKVGDDPDLWIDALESRKHSHMQFAGEHCTHVANGCVHGAFATGEKAAKNLLNTFNIKYDGGDFVSVE